MAPLRSGAERPSLEPLNEEATVSSTPRRGCCASRSLSRLEELLLVSSLALSAILFACVLLTGETPLLLNILGSRPGPSADGRALEQTTKIVERRPPDFFHRPTLHIRHTTLLSPLDRTSTIRDRAPRSDTVHTL